MRRNSTEEYVNWQTFGAVLVAVVCFGYGLYLAGSTLILHGKSGLDAPYSYVYHSGKLGTGPAREATSTVREDLQGSGIFMALGFLCLGIAWWERREILDQ